MATKQELKSAYKEYRPTMGVFAIRNLSNDKVLIDYSTDMKSKWIRHRTELNFGSHRNKQLQHDWTELGADQFTFEVLSELKESKEKQVNYKAELKTLVEMVIEEHTSSKQYA